MVGKASFSTFICLNEMAKNINAEHKNKYLILHALAQNPNLTVTEAAREYGVNRHTVRRWCNEAQIRLVGQQCPRVRFILDIKIGKRTRLICELAQIEREIKALKEQDPNAPYQKPKEKK